MKLVEIKGKLWELTILQLGYDKIENKDISTTNFNILITNNQYLKNCRLLANNEIRSTAKAILENEINKLPCQQEYVIYLNKKGFYCKAQGKIVYLKSLLNQLIIKDRI